MSTIVSTPSDYSTSLAHLGGRIRWAIEKKLGMKQAEFARQVGLKRQMLSRWINDPSGPPSAKSLKKLAEATHTTVSWLLYGTDLNPFTADPEFYVTSTDARTTRVSQLIDLLIQKDALRRWAGTVPLRDLVKGAYQIAFDEGWTEEEFKQLDEWRRELLGSEGDET